MVNFRPIAARPYYKITLSHEKYLKLITNHFPHVKRIEPAKFGLPSLGIVL